MSMVSDSMSNEFSFMSKCVPNVDVLVCCVIYLLIVFRIIVSVLIEMIY